MSYYPEPDSYSRNQIKVELDLSNYATKSDLKETTGVDIAKFAEKADLTSLKSDVDELDINKVKTVPTDLSQLSDVVKNEVLKKTVYDELVKKIDAIHAIDTSDLVFKNDYDKIMNF